MMKPRLFPILCAASLAAALGGCSKGNPYKEVESLKGSPSIPLRAVVTDFEDVRQPKSEYNSGATKIPLMLYGSYKNTRFDELDRSANVSFPTMTAQEIAERMKELGVFESVTYYPAGELPAPGEYDLLVKGRIEELTAKGKKISYGLSLFSDLPWYIGAPHLTRNWDIDMDLWVQDAYTGNTVGDRVNAEWNTGSAIYTIYKTTRTAEDLQNRIAPIYDQAIQKLVSSIPSPSDVAWVTLKDEGDALLAAQARDQDRIRRGTPPTFSFLSPVDGSTVRTPTTTIQWGIAAPNGLKSAVLVANNETVSLGLNALDMASEETAPKTVAARETELPLILGKNTFQARVNDHRENVTDAELTITRLPKSLNPQRRFALLFGTGSSVAKNSVNSLREVLVDPMIGQFDEQDVTSLTIDSVDSDSLTTTINTFGASGPLAGDLAFVYLATEGSRDSMTISGTELTLDAFTSRLASSLATENVIFVCDIDWDSKGSEDLADELSSLNQRWAFFVPESTGGMRPLSEGKTLVADLMIRSLRGEFSQDRLTLERFFDELIIQMERVESSLSPDLSGRPNPSMTLAERE